MSRKTAEPQVKAMLHPKTIKEIKHYHSKIQTTEDIDKLGSQLNNVLTLTFLENRAKISITSPSETSEDSKEQQPLLLEEFQQSLPGKNERRLYPYGGEAGKLFWEKYPQLKSIFLEYIQSLKLTDFFFYIIKTQRAFAIAEQTLTLMGDWTLEEISILEQTSILVNGVTVYDNGTRTRGKYTRHPDPFLASLVSINGHLFANKFNNLTPAWGYVVKEVKMSSYEFYEIDPKQFGDLYVRKFLPSLMKMNAVVSGSNRRVLMSLVGVGAGYFAGLFSGKYIQTHLKGFNRNFITQKGALFPNIDVSLDLYMDTENGIEKIGNNYLIHAPSATTGISPLSETKDYDKSYSGFWNKPSTLKHHHLLKVIAADPLSRGAEFIPVQRREKSSKEALDGSINHDSLFASDDPASWRATSLASAIFNGEPGNYYYNPSSNYKESKGCGAYLPNAYDSWYDFIIETGFVFDLDESQIFTINEEESRVLSAEETVSYFDKVVVTNEDQKGIDQAYNWVRERNFTHRTVQLYSELDKILEIKSIPKINGPLGPRLLSSGWIAGFCQGNEEEKQEIKSKSKFLTITNLDIWRWVNQPSVKEDIGSAINLIKNVEKIVNIHSRNENQSFANEFKEEFGSIFDKINQIYKKNDLSLGELQKNFKLLQDLHYVINSIRDFYKRSEKTTSKDKIIEKLKLCLKEYLTSEKILSNKESTDEKEEKNEKRTAKDLISNLRNKIESMFPQDQSNARPYFSLFPPFELNATILINDNKQIEIKFGDQKNFQIFTREVPIFEEKIPTQFQQSENPSLLPLGKVAISNSKEQKVSLSSYLATGLNERGINLIKPENLQAFMNFFQLFHLKCKRYNHGINETEHTYVNGLFSVYWVTKTADSKNATIYLRNMAEAGSFIEFKADGVFTGNNKKNTRVPVAEVKLDLVQKPVFGKGTVFMPYSNTSSSSSSLSSSTTSPSSLSLSYRSQET